MALTPRLDLRQTQQLVLTPQLQQAIKLLQMANLELSGFIEQEVERNPLLEIGEGEGDSPETPDGDSYELSGFDGDEGVYSADAGLGGDGMVADSDAPLDADYSVNVFDDAPLDRPMADAGGVLQPGPIGNGSPGSSYSAQDGDSPDQYLSEMPNLKTHLSQEMTTLIHDPQQRLIAANLIDLLDEAGYLEVGYADVAERLGVSADDVQMVLARLQTLEPTGVFARDLAECLSLQLIERDRFDPAMQTLIANLHLLGRHDFAALKRICAVDDEDLADMIAEVRALNPRPGLLYGAGIAQPVVPDVFVRQAMDGSWAVELNNETLPKVLVNQHYYAQLNARTADKKDRQFLSECLSTANWLVRALDQRARTILKVSSEIVSQQEGFFTHGVRHLRPLTLRDVADAITMHESTVSRVTSGKFMATSRGIFELKFFFTSAIQAAEGGEAYSSESVRARIRTLIDEEDPARILSDDRLVDMLKEEGIDIARRTVAKYREAMRIPSSVQRRREKRILAPSTS